jgi:hypothetical protein
MRMCPAILQRNGGIRMPAAKKLSLARLTLLSGLFV